MTIKKGVPPPPERRITLEELREEVERNQAFVHMIALRWRRAYPLIPLEDYVGAVHLGFCEATRLFDRARGFKFTTYAKWWADNEVRKLIAVHDERRGPEIRGRKPLPNSSPTVRIRFGLDPIVSPYGEGTTTADNLLPAREERHVPLYEPEEFWRSVGKCLDQREQIALELHYRGGWNYVRIGQRLGVSRERVRQIIDRSLAKVGESRAFRDYVSV